MEFSFDRLFKMIEERFGRKVGNVLLLIVGLAIATFGASIVYEKGLKPLYTVSKWVFDRDIQVNFPNFGLLMGGVLLTIGAAVVTLVGSMMLGFVITRIARWTWHHFVKRTKDAHEKAGEGRWFFRLGGIGFTRLSFDKPESAIVVDLMASNLLDRPASISHFVLETHTPEGNLHWLEPVPRERLPEARVMNGRKELVAPLYFQPRESKVGQLTFHVQNDGGGVNLLYIRDEDGTEYRLELSPKTMFRIASIVRKEDYPTSATS